MPNSQVDVTAGAPNLASYKDNGDGTITDNVTGLMWQKSVSATTGYTYAQAGTYCQNLALAGYGGWRLPTKIELFSIVDVGRDTPAIDPNAFPGTPTQLPPPPTGPTMPGAWFWTSLAFPYSGVGAECPPDKSCAMAIEFNSGATGAGDVANMYLVRCVR
jgi:hypothetical protein